MIVVPNRGVAQNVQTNNAWISFINHDSGGVLLVRCAPGVWMPIQRAVWTQGNIVVVNIGSADVLTFAPDAKLLRTEAAVQSGNDGVVIMPDGTKYVSSVVLGGVSRIRPGQPAELIAQNIPNAASMCYDAGASQLVIPLNANNGLAFVSIK